MTKLKAVLKEIQLIKDERDRVGNGLPKNYNKFLPRVNPGPPKTINNRPPSKYSNKSYLQRIDEILNYTP